MTTEDEELERQRPQVRRAVFAGIARRRVVRQRRLIAIVAGAGLLLAAGTAIGAAKLAPHQPEGAVESSLICYFSDDLNGGFQEVQVVPDELTEEVARDVCSTESRYDEDELAYCLDPSGIRALIPIIRNETGPDLCARLGLPVWDDSFEEESP